MLSLKWEVDLKTGASLEYIFHGEDEQKWKFSHILNLRDEPRGRTRTYIRIWAYVNYRRGILANSDELLVKQPHAVSLNMKIIFPERLGKKFRWGMDLSPGAKNYVELLYRLDADRTLRAFWGKVNRSIFDIDPEEPGSFDLATQTDYPLWLTIPFDSGYAPFGYRVPYLKEDKTQEFFRFPGQFVLHDGSDEDNALFLQEMPVQGALSSE